MLRVQGVVIFVVACCVSMSAGLAAETSHIGISRSQLVNLSTSAENPVQSGCDTSGSGGIGFRRVGANRTSSTFYQVPEQKEFLLTDVSWREYDPIGLGSAGTTGVLYLLSFVPDLADSRVIHYQLFASNSSVDQLLVGSEHLTTPIRIGADRVVCALFLRELPGGGGTLSTPIVWLTGYHLRK